MKNRLLIVLSLVFVLVSLAGGYYILVLSKQPSYTSQVPEVTLPTPTPEYSDPVQEETTTNDESMVLDETAQEPESTPTPIPEFLSFQSDDDNFSVSYKSQRKFYQDTEKTGNRYTFFISNSNNITLHVGDSWSWDHPARVFSSDLTVSGQPTFTFEVSSQKLTDFESGNKKYTVQCVHFGSESVKAECDALISSFKLL